jgi:hypothetical protein
VSNAVRLTPTPSAYVRWPPSHAEKPAIPNPSAERSLPRPRRPRRRERHEARWRRSATVLALAWRVPTLRGPPRVSDQSERPESAVGTAASDPARMSLSAARGLLAAESVEQERARPGADDDVGEGGVEWVPEPRAAEGVLHAGALGHEPVGRLLERLRDGVEGRELLERCRRGGGGGDGLGHGRGMPSACPRQPLAGDRADDPCRVRR